jgi:hypothetical protein
MMEVTHAKGVENVVLRQGEQKQLSSGEVLRFAAITGVPTVTLRGRSTPGHPWALASATLLAVGLLMMGRRWLLV